MEPIIGNPFPGGRGIRDLLCLDLLPWEALLQLLVSHPRPSSSSLYRLRGKLIKR